jgi:hypothetical protein
VLAASAAGLPLLITACKGVQVLGSPPPPPAEIATLRAAITAEQDLVTAYGAAVSPASAGTDGATDGGTAMLAAVLAEHRQHLSQLKSRLIETAAQRSAAAASAGPSGPVRTGAPPAIVQLEQAEAAASDRLIGQLAGLPPSLAQLFASIAAAEATHVPLLRSLGRRP